MALYDPAGMATAGKIPVHILPALTSLDLSAVTVAEMTAGTQVDTAMTSFNSTSDQSTRDRKMLSDTVAEQIGGQITRSLDMGTLAAMDPQSTDALKTLLVEGATRCHNETLSLADLALASHLIGAERFGVELSAFPRVTAVGASLFKLPEIESSHPRYQVGAITA